MSLSLLNNVPALQTQRRLSENSSALNKSFQRLSSGLRINRASDDAAGLAISASLDNQARVLGQGTRNISDGVSALSIAEGALTELTNIIIRQTELAEQSANGTFSNTQRQALDKEARQLTNEFNRIVATTQFNNINLLDGTRTSLDIQAGFNTIALALPQGSTSVNDGTFQAPVNYTLTGGGNGYGEGALGDFNGDGALDIVMPDFGNARIDVALGNGDGTFKARTSYTGSAGVDADSVWSVDFNNDGYDDIVQDDKAGGRAWVYLANSNGSFKSRVSYVIIDPRDIYAADVNNDGFNDILVPEGVAGGQAIGVLLNNGNGTFKAQVQYGTGGDSAFVRTGDFNGDGIIDMVAPTNGNNHIAVLLGNGNGTFKTAVTYVTPSSTSLELGDFNNDGILDIATANWSADNVSVLLGNSNGSFKAQLIIAAGTDPFHIAVGDANGDGNLDFVSSDSGSNNLSLFLGNGDGTFQARQSIGTGNTPMSVELADLNGDSVLDIFVANTNSGTAGIYIGNGEFSFLAPDISLATQDEARTALTTLKNTLTGMTRSAATIGAGQSRLTFAADTLWIQQLTLQGASSTIRDADVAEETANLARQSILQQAGASVLAQANQQPQLALTLLQAVRR